MTRALLLAAVLLAGCASPPVHTEHPVTLALDDSVSYAPPPSAHTVTIVVDPHAAWLRASTVTQGVGTAYDARDVVELDAHFERLDVINLGLDAQTVQVVWGL